MFVTSLKIVKLIQTLSDAATYHFAGNFWKRFSDPGCLIKCSAVCQLLKSSSAVESLYLGKDCFDRVELWTVADVEDGRDVKFFTYRLNVSRPVNRKLVHEDR
jgi:hypothetical protein